MYAHERSLVQRLANRPFALIGVNSDPADKAQDALERENITWRSFSNGGSTRGPISAAWGVTGWPTIYLIDHAGVIRFKNVRGEAMDKAVDELMEPAMQALAESVTHDDPAVRGLAAFRLGRYGVADAVAVIQPLLEDGDAVVQQRAATGLALLGQPTEPLLEKVRNAVTDADPEVRVASLEVLGGAKDAAAAALAVTALEDAIVAVRVAALKALGQVGTAENVGVVVQRLEDAKFTVAREAAAVLATMNLPESIAALTTAAGQADHPARVWITVAMHRIDPAQTDVRVKALMADADAATRRRTANVLPEFKDYDATDVFIAALEDTDDVVSRTARAFLKDSPAPRAQEALKQFILARVDKSIPLLSSKEMPERSKAQNELFGLGPDVAPLLMERLGQLEDAGAYAALAQVVGALQNPAVVPAIVTQLKDPGLDPPRRNALEGMARYFRTELANEAVELVKSDQSPLRQSGIRILALTLDDRAPAILKPMLTDADAAVRVAAAVSLARLQDPAALPVLLELTKGADIPAQQQAIIGLANYPEATALPPLRELLGAETPNVRIQAFNMLQRFKSAEVTKLIVEQSAADPTLLRLAPAVLGRQGTADAVKALAEFLKSDDLVLRRQAEGALSQIRLPAARAVLEEYRKQQAEQEEQKKDTQ